MEYLCYDYLRVGIWSWFRMRSMFQMISGHIHVWLMLHRCDSSRNRNSATPAICIFVCNYYIISCLGFYIVKEQLNCFKRFCNILFNKDLKLIGWLQKKFTIWCIFVFNRFSISGHGNCCGCSTILFFGLYSDIAIWCCSFFYRLLLWEL